MSEQEDLKKIQYILQEYSDKDFVQRILYPQEYPSIDLGNGYSGTHLMSWSGHKDHSIVYPSIVHENGKLQRLDPEAAYKRAVDTGEYIPFVDAKEADWFSKNYKKVWK